MLVVHLKTSESLLNWSKNLLKWLRFLRSQQAKTKMIKDIEIVPLLFNKDLKKGEATRIGENIHYGLLFGKFKLLKSPLLVHYSNLSQVSKVVACICPSQAAVTLVSDPEAINSVKEIEPVLSAIKPVL